MKIIELKLRNFKGIKDLTIKPDGKNINIYGNNGSGKTTCMDAYLWLLFDKDSSDRKDFEVKTIDADGGVIHNLEHEVTATLEVNGALVTLKKMLKEKWTRKRGTETQEFTGHETTLWIDELPVKKSEYDAKIESIMPESLFKLLSNPSYFNEQLKWTDRRKALFDAFVKNDVDLFALDPKLEEIREDVEKAGAENVKKITADKKRLLNNELEQIPSRVDEVTRGIPDLEGITEAVAERDALLLEKADIEKQITAQEEKKRDADKAITAYNNKKIELERLKNKIVEEATKEYSEAKEKGTKLYYEIQGEKKSIELLTKQIAEGSETIEKLKTEKEGLIKEWKTINAKTFETPDIDNFKCTTCGQPLPEDDIANKIDEMKANFARNKKNRLDAISKQGEDNNKKSAEEKEALIQREAMINEHEKSIQAKTEEMDKYKKIHEEGQNKQVDYENHSEYIKLAAELELMLQNTFDDSDLVTLKKAKDTINAQITEQEKKITKKDVADAAEKRIQQLRDRQKELSQEIANLEKKEFLIEEYIKLKSRTVESTINSQFKTVRFKLFDTQINGGVNEICVATVNNVPYPDLNNAGKIQAGLDIIQAFSNVHSLEAPIFIDNSESVIKIPETAAQQIRLYVWDDTGAVKTEWEKNGKLYMEVN